MDNNAGSGQALSRTVGAAERSAQSQLQSKPVTSADRLAGISARMESQLKRVSRVLARINNDPPQSPEPPAANLSQTGIIPPTASLNTEINSLEDRVDLLSVLADQLEQVN